MKIILSVIVFAIAFPLGINFLNDLFYSGLHSIYLDNVFLKLISNIVSLVISSLICIGLYKLIYRNDYSV
jgi:hypothetical protein